MIVADAENSIQTAAEIFTTLLPCRIRAHTAVQEKLQFFNQLPLKRWLVIVPVVTFSHPTRES